MHNQKKKSVLFSMLVLMMIITTAITPTIRGQAFNAEEPAETPIIPAPDMDDLEGQDSEPEVNETQETDYTPTDDSGNLPSDETTSTPEPTADPTEDLGEKCAGDKDYGGDDDNKCGFDEKPPVEETEETPTPEGDNPEGDSPEGENPDGESSDNDITEGEDPANENLGENESDDENQGDLDDDTEDTDSGDQPDDDQENALFEPEDPFEILTSSENIIVEDVSFLVAYDLEISVESQSECDSATFTITVRNNRGNGNINNVKIIFNFLGDSANYIESYDNDPNTEINLGRINAAASKSLVVNISTSDNWNAGAQISLEAEISGSSGNNSHSPEASASAVYPENCSPVAVPVFGITVTPNFPTSLPAVGCEPVQFDIMLTNSGDAVALINETVQLTPSSGTIDPAADASLTFTAVDAPQTITVADPWIDPITTEVTLSATFDSSSTAYTATIQKDEVCTAVLAPAFSVVISVNGSESSCVQMVFDVAMTNNGTESGNATVEVIDTAFPGTVIETMSFSNIDASGGTSTQQLSITGPWSQYSFPMTLRATITNLSDIAPFDEITAEEPNACPSQGNPGAIWTTTYGCDSVQNENHFAAGETVYIRGNNFNPGFYNWSITGQPGGASGDPNTVVASSGSNPYVVHNSGEFCFAAYIIQSDDWGEYTVDFGRKNDNYRVREQASVDVNLTCVPSVTYGSLTQVSITAPNNQVKNLSWSYTGDTHTTNPIILRGTGTLTITWEGKGNYEGGSLEILIIGCEEKVLVEPPTISVTCAFEGTDYKHEWTVTNNDPDTAIDFSWTSDIGETAATIITLGVAEETSFTTSYEAQTLTVNFNLSGEAITDLLSVTKDSAACIYTPLTLQQTCLEIGDHHWTVTNNNPQDIEFDWVSTTDSKTGYSVEVKANGGTTTFTTNGQHPQTVTLTYPYAGRTGIQVSEATTESCQLPLSLTFICGYPGEPLMWQVSNPNPFPVEYSWKGYRSGIFSSHLVQTGTGTAPAGSSTFISSLLVEWVKLKVDGELVTTADNTGVCMLDLKLEYQCLDDGQQGWKVKNLNAFSQDFTLTIDGDSTQETVSASSQFSFTLENGEHTVMIAYQNAPHLTRSKTVTSENCILPLTIEPVCGYPGDAELHWMITNPNQDSAGYLWIAGRSIVPIDYGIKNAPPGVSYIITTHTLITWVSILSEEGDFDKAYKTAPCLLDLTIRQECQEDGSQKWYVSNPNDFSQAFNWSTSSGDNGSGQSPAGQDSTSFMTSNAAHTVTISYTNSPHASRSISTTAEICVLDPIVDYSCQDFDNSHIWDIVNPNPFPILISWKIDSGDFNDTWNEIPANQTSPLQFAESHSDLQSLTLKYKYGSEAPITLSPITTESCKVSSYELKNICGYPSDANLYWEIINNYSKDIEFQWETAPGGEKGNSKMFGESGKNTTQIVTGLDAETLIIFVNGNEVARADAEEICKFDLILDYQCLDSSTHRWTLTNNNVIDLTYTRYIDNVPFGTATINANSSSTFITPNGDQTIKIEYEQEPFGTKQVSAHAESCPIDSPPSTTSSQPAPSTTAGLTGSTCPQWILFHSLRDGNLEIYRLDGVEGVGNFELINLSQHSAKDSHPSRSFDDQWVAFQSDRDGNSEIYLTDSMGQSQVRLTDNPAEDINPMFAPDNVNIVFQSNRNGSWDLYMVNRITQQEVQLTDHDADETNPFAATNNNLLVYESNRGGNQDIFMLNLETGDELQVTHNIVDEINPAVSPDGQAIAYLAPGDGVWQLFVSEVNGDNVRQITNGDGDTTNHAWSPDGTRLAYQSLRDGNLDIYSYDLRDQIENRVTDNPEDDSAPTWDCSGTFLAYTTTADEQSTDIYRVYWKGGSSSFLTNHPAADKWSQWSPAKEIASREK